MLHSSRIPVPTVWCYRPADPYTVTIGFRGPVRWDIDRDLVAEGLRHTAGVSDVWMWPAGRDRVSLFLSARGPSALFTALTRDVRRFLALTYGWVPAGQEPAFLDIDSAVRQLLGGRS
jgi:hypothetical protein